MNEIAQMQEVVLAIPRGLDTRALHECVYDTMLQEGQMRDFLFTPHGPSSVLIRAQSFPPHLAGFARPVDLPAAGEEFGFRLRASPVRKLNGKRRVMFGLGDREGRIAWMYRRADQHGFEILDLAVASRGDEVRGKGFFDECVFVGRARVRDAPVFAASLIKGIGPAHTYGYGCLVLTAG